MLIEMATVGTVIGTIKGVTAAGKALVDFLKYDEKVKTVDNEWLDKSGFGGKASAEGYKLRWTKADKIESRKLDGYEIVYEFEKLKRVKHSIEHGGLVLMGKKG